MSGDQLCCLCWTWTQSYVSRIVPFTIIYFIWFISLDIFLVSLSVLLPFPLKSKSWDQLCCHYVAPKLQALFYNILPSTTAAFSYTIRSRKLSANKQFFVGAQTIERLLQTTQIILDVCFITDHVAYASSNKTKIIWIKMELFFFFFFTRGGCTSCLRACLGARLLPQSY